MLARRNVSSAAARVGNFCLNIFYDLSSVFYHSLAAYLAKLPIPRVQEATEKQNPKSLTFASFFTKERKRAMEIRSGVILEIQAPQSTLRQGRVLCDFILLLAKTAHIKKKLSTGFAKPPNRRADRKQSSFVFAQMQWSCGLHRNELLQQQELRFLRSSNSSSTRCIGLALGQMFL